MNFSKAILMALATSCGLAVQASPPIEFVSVVRNSDGKALSDKEVKVSLDIAADPLASTILYSEYHKVHIGSDGILRIMIGEGESDALFDAVDWSGRRYLRVQVDTDGSGYRSIGTMEFAGAPTAMQAREAEGLERTSPSGETWRLSVSDMGELGWEKVNLGPAYDLSKVPENLYFIGDFNNWTVAEAVPMTKLSPTQFTITRKLSTKEIFKFVPTRSWANDVDWSAKTSNLNTPNPMAEFGNTPAFSASSGTYAITVDFYTFTMTITPL